MGLFDGSRNVTVTYWNPDSLRFMQDVYEIPVRKWNVSLGAESRCDTMPSCTSAAMLNVRRNRVTMFGGYQFTTLSNLSHHGPTVGLRINLVGKP